jgi:hypothetical protein
MSKIENGFEAGARVAVFVFDEATGGRSYDGVVRRMISKDFVKVRLDAGLDVAAHVADVTACEDDAAGDERQAA